LRALSALNPNFSSSFHLQINVGTTFTKTHVYSGNVVVLLEVSIPETLEENPYNIITDLRGMDFVDIEKRRERATNSLVKYTKEQRVGIYGLDYLSHVSNARIHWVNFKDFVPTALYYKDELHKRIQDSFPAGLQVVMTYEGVPELYVDLYDYVTKTITLKWLPVLGHKGYVIHGELYKGADVRDVTFLITTVLTTLDDLAKQKSFNIAFGLDQVLFFKMRTFIYVNGSKIYGPDSNIVKYSF
jgi:hypothetical protein